MTAELAPTPINSAALPLASRPVPNLSALTLEQKVGQVLCLGWDADSERGDALTVNAHARALVEELGAGSIIVMGRNYARPEQLRATLAELQSLAAVPLFVAVDQEGGSVNRFGPPFTAFPGNMALGAIARDAAGLTRAQAELQAEELTAIGVNWNFAPVLDVNNNPDNPIIGIRSYGSDPARVAELGAAAVEGYQRNGLLACAKHFPGHGDTGVDSHHALPTIPGDRERLNSVELVPFRAAIAAGVGAIMTTHILFPALDSVNPATLSPAILTGLLRQELGYNGVVITDCLEMGAIADGVGVANATVEAIKAGADVALICHTLSVQRESRQALLDAVRSGELPESRLDEAVERVLAAKQRFPAAPRPSVLVDSGGDFSDDEIKQAATQRLLEPALAELSITIVREHETQGVQFREGDDLIVVSGHHSLPALVDALAAFATVQAFDIAASFPEAETQRALGAIRQSSARVVVATSPPEPWTKSKIDIERQAQFVRDVHALVGPRLIVVALREPYDIRRFPDIENYVCTYGTRPCSLAALAAVLYGDAQPTGVLPVTIPLSVKI